MPSAQTIIVLKKKKAHAHRAHGGAWKVAYADFVTAMMAFFLVLWLMSSSNDVKEAIAGYFSNPKGFAKTIGTGMSGSGHGITITKEQMPQLKETLEQAIRQHPAVSKLKEHVHMTMTPEGLRIELLETDKGMFFENGRSDPTEGGREVLIALANELGKLNNSIIIEGHTDSKPYDNPVYSNWELSADRANSARKIIQANGVATDQVSQVRGFADQQLRFPTRPEDPSNRRVSIIVAYPQITERDAARNAAATPRTKSAGKK